MDYTYFLAYKPHVKSFFDNVTNTITHVVVDMTTRECAVIDSVLDYEPYGATLSYTNADKVIAYIQEEKLTVTWILETHVHADHISAAAYIKERCGGKIAIGKAIVKVQEFFGDAFYEDERFARDGSQFDVLLEPDTSYAIGALPMYVVAVPGHTPADSAYVIGDAVFVGDTLFMPDYGSARCDFPGGSAELLYDSIQTLFALPDSMRVFLCHDYLPQNGRTDYQWETTIGQEKENNIHLGSKISRNDFIDMRTKKDKTLSVPKLIIPSLQINMRGGVVPKNKDGSTILTIPVNGAFSSKSKSV